MPTGPEHYLEAERLLDTARKGLTDNGLVDKHQALRAASVHATLALAAATALQTPDGEDAGMYAADAEAWEQACSAAAVETTEETQP